jgi:hypothetical protein
LKLFIEACSLKAEAEWSVAQTSVIIFSSKSHRRRSAWLRSEKPDDQVESSENPEWGKSIQNGYAIVVEERKTLGSCLFPVG